MKEYLYVIKLGSNTYNIGVGSRGEVTKLHNRLSATIRRPVVLMGTIRINVLRSEMLAKLDCMYGHEVNRFGVYTLTNEDVNNILDTARENMGLNASQFKAESKNLNVYVLTKYLCFITGKTISHTRVKNKVLGWTKLLGFGSCEKIVVKALFSNSKKKEVDIHTLTLTTVQCIAVAGTFSMDIQMAVIDRLQYLEEKFTNNRVYDELFGDVFSDPENIHLFDVIKYVNQQLGGNVDHSKLMSRKVPFWSKSKLFGDVNFKIIHLSTPNGGKRLVKTCCVTPKQTIAIAGTLSMAVQLLIIGRLTRLEKLYTPNKSMGGKLAEAISAYADYVNGIEPQSLACAIIEQRSSRNDNHIFQYKPGYFILNPTSDEPCLLTAQELTDLEYAPMP